MYIGIAMNSELLLGCFFLNYQYQSIVILTTVVRNFAYHQSTKMPTSITKSTIFESNLIKINEDIVKCGQRKISTQIIYICTLYSHELLRGLLDISPGEVHLQQFKITRRKPSSSPQHSIGDVVRYINNEQMYYFDVYDLLFQDFLIWNKSRTLIQI